jgi:hypothetical protein
MNTTAAMTATKMTGLIHHCLSNHSKKHSRHRPRYLQQFRLQSPMPLSIYKYSNHLFLLLKWWRPHPRRHAAAAFPRILILDGQCTSGLSRHIARYYHGRSFVKTRAYVMQQHCIHPQ